MIGIDTTTVERIKKLVDKWGDRFYKKTLNEKEILLCKGKFHTFAGFFAAKEAASKAIGTGIGGSCGFHDIKIKKDKNGAPKIKYKKEIRKKFGIKNSYLSITHNENIVIAIVVNVLK
ncbi:MAG: holo-ACP synthase [Arcobacter sp.]|jgi:holo-[acyl-carrier protein] synthase|uniref:holo-ACP synthase n=1 Tax=Arcobacter sp. TaxID=1872629 RepID=UPI0025871A08|nr:holo-ACP synthase [Arcobacter sp.]MDD3007659.1 holo-ACP synthase [Arcobacter sp.]MDY3203950.1 holo-ACP synthase [Arcobacter sp.]